MKSIVQAHTAQRRLMKKGITETIMTYGRLLRHTRAWHIALNIKLTACRRTTVSVY